MNIYILLSSIRTVYRGHARKLRLQKEYSNNQSLFGFLKNHMHKQQPLHIRNVNDMIRRTQKHDLACIRDINDHSKMMTGSEGIDTTSRVIFTTQNAWSHGGPFLVEQYILIL
jgi:hypothetical protein